MSKGDLKSEGLKGNNYPFQKALLQILGGILDNTPTPPMGGLATESTLLDVLSAVDSMRDYEVRLVVDSDTPPVTWLEVRYWDAQDGTLGAPVFYPPGSTVAGTPTGSISYINPNTLLASLLAELMAQTVLLTSIDADTSNLDVPLSTVATETTLGNIETLLTTIDSVLDDIKTNTDSLDVDLSTRASEATLELVRLQLVSLNTVDFATETTLSAIQTLLTGASRAPSVSNEVADGSTTGGVKAVSLWFRGTGGTLDGVAVPSGARFTFSADDNNDTVASIPFTVPTGGQQRIIVTYLT